jgi:hypothetical protein
MTDSSIESMGAAKASCEVKANEVVEAVEARFPITDITHVWGYDPNKYNPEHHSGLAADFMLYNKKVSGGIDVAAGNWIAAYLIENEVRLGVRWLLWRQRIWNPAKGGWRDMLDRGNPTNNHMDHVHVLFKDTPYVAPGKKVVAVKPKPPASAIPSVLQKEQKLVVDGKLGETTIRAWQDILGTPEDGKISEPSSMVQALQLFLNRHGFRDAKGRRLVVDGYGLGSNLRKDYGPTHTVEALQRFYRTPVDGVISHPTSALVKAIQAAINKQNGH